MATSQQSSLVRILISAECGNFCVAADDGEAIFERIKDALEAGQTVALSFAGVESLSTAFLNSAIGQLLEVVSNEDLNTRLKIVDLNSDDMLMLRRVIANAKRYYANPQQFLETQKQLEAA